MRLIRFTVTSMQIGRWWAMAKIKRFLLLLVSSATPNKTLLANAKQVKIAFSFSTQMLQLAM